MVTCGSYMHEFSVSKIWGKCNNDKRREEVAVGKVVAHLTLISKIKKNSVEQDRVVTTLNIIKH
jgi:hypothetical protein